VVEREIPSPRRESKFRTPIVQPVAQRYNSYFSFRVALFLFIFIFLRSIFEYSFSLEDCEEFSWYLK